MTRARARWYPLALALLASPSAHAQSRTVDNALTVSVAQPAPRCTLHARPLVPQSPDASPDPHTAPVVASTELGTLVAFRTGRDALFLARLAAGSFERLGPDRELARPAGPFAIAPSAGGASLAMVERTSFGESAVLFARLSPSGEARNVPRELGRAASVDGVAIAWTGAGYVVAWGAQGGVNAPVAASGTWLIGTDARGVPRAPARRLLDATQPRLVYLPGANLVVLTATAGESAEPTIVALDAEGATTDSARWSPLARGLVAGGAGSSAIALAVSPGTDTPTPGVAPFASLALSRWSVDDAPTDALLGFRVAPDAQIVALAPDRVGTLAAIDDPAGRELIVRVAPDGTVVPLASRPGSLGAFFFSADNTVTVVGHEPPPAGQGRLAIVQLACPRPAPPPVVTAPAYNSAASNSTNATSPDAGEALERDATVHDASDRDP